jgi:LysR family glycine cleavage system transcriptional activator
MDAEMVAVGSPRLNVRRAVKTPADLAKFPLLHKAGKASRWTEWMAEAGVTLDGPLPGHSYETFAMIVEAAVAAHGIGLLPYYLIADDVAARRLEIIGREFADFRLSYFLMLPESRAGVFAIRSFAFWLIEEARKFNAGITDAANKKVRRLTGPDKAALTSGIAARSRSAVPSLPSPARGGS